MTERLVIAALLVALCAATLYCVRRRSPLEPSVLLVATTVLVGTFYPIGAALVPPLTWRHGAYLPQEVVLDAQWQYLAFALGACAIVARVRWRRTESAEPPRAYRTEDDPARSFRDLVIAGGLVIGGGLLYAIYIKKVGLAPLMDRSNFAEKYRVSSGLGTFYIGLNLVIAGCLWAEASTLSRGLTRAFRAIALGVMIWSIGIVAVRTYAVALFLGYVYLACRDRGFSLARVRPWVVIALGVGYAGIESYAMLRGAWKGSLMDAMRTVQQQQKGIEQTLGQIVGGSELSHPFLTAMELAQFEEAGSLRGSSYANAALGVLPLWLYPDRPPTPAQEFAREHYPSFEARGGGTAFSVVGEAWWNFGSLVGPFGVGLALAYLLSSLERRSRTCPWSAVARFQPYLVHMIVLAHRGSSVSIAKHLFSVLLPVMLLATCAGVIWRALGARAEQAERSLNTLSPVEGGA
ncbi:MAG: hypothetical protein R3F49_21040 [Planctomycetota bacterium]